MTGLNATEEPAGRRTTGEPARWKRSLRFHYGGRFGSSVYVRRELHGVTWLCPKCGNDDTVVLRHKGRSEYWFRCRRIACRWRLDFNHISAEQLAASLGAEVAARAPTDAERRATEIAERLIAEERGRSELPE